MAVAPNYEKSLSFSSTESFRKALMGKNLSAYKIEGVYSPPTQNLNYETVLTDSPVIDSPNELISKSPYGTRLYPLNKYGPNGGYNQQISYNRPPLAVNSNQGEYQPNDTKMDLVNEFFIDLAFIENKFGPPGGFQNMITITDVQNNNKIYANYWGPPSFVPSSYPPLQILQSNNPTGSDGNLSADSYLAKLSATNLKKLFQERIDVQRRKESPSQNQLDSLKDPYTASLMATGKQPLIVRDYTITVPETPQNAVTSLQTRLGDTFYPVSPIPGDYFNENTLLAGSTQQASTALNAANRLLGGLLGGALNTIRNPSQIFIANTGDGQKGVLFANLDYNRYQPRYDRTTGGIARRVDNVIQTALTSLGDPTGGYYVGSPTNDPSQITTPANEIPVNVFGQQVSTTVYGPSELGKLYEGNDNQINFGPQANSFSDGGGIDGSLVWISPKYKGNAGFKAGVGGGVKSFDQEFNTISNSYLKSESTNISFKPNSLLDNTQRLIISADGLQGERRLKHVGNAINQVSKVFNDGYRELTKGSKVLTYKNNTTGNETGTEYCRVFAKDTPYYTYNDLQKVEGITTTNRKFNNSVLDSTFNLNIAPTPYEKGSTNIILKDGKKSVKKYMFSLENLAWRTSSKNGFTYDDLPDSEKGPNGGRIMWFPPYNIKFSETITPSFNGVDFLGRPEPVYTYSKTSRSGQLSWTIIVDHPSILNLIVKKQLNGVDKQKVQSIVDSFFAGCVKYDLIELAKKFNTIPSKDLLIYQDILSKPSLTTEDVKIIKESLVGQPDESNGTTTDNTDNDKTFLESKFNGYGFYFDNNVPGNSSSNYSSDYESYISRKQTYIDNSKNLSGSEKNVEQFFNSVISENFDKFTSGDENTGLISKLIKYLESGKAQNIQINLIASASALGDDGYNQKLSERRRDSIKTFFETFSVGGKNLEQFIKDGILNIDIVALGETATIDFEKTVSPVSDGSKQTSIECTKLQPENARIFSVSAMACRRVAIKEIKITPKTPDTKNKKEPIKQITTTNGKKTTIIPPRKIGVEEKLKTGITQKILRSLLTEDSYFELLKSQNPMIYDSIVDKIKYFNPAFHSMTPEGLNSRLTFLQQCARPGETIPIIGPDGKPRFNDALNTSFGAPPILVLRIGDFFNTKIVPTSLSFTYDNGGIQFDTNPEGIGVQPMFVNVSMGFNFIGGSGLAKPIEQLQNALSFNYYANTEIYDDRAIPTEDTSAIDKEVFQSILDKETPNLENQINQEQQNPGGTTIGQVLSSQSNETGTNGEISYSQIMDKLHTDTKTYFTTFLNQTEKILKAYNKGIIQLINGSGPKVTKFYTEGNLGTTKTEIFGKPNLTTSGEKKDRFQQLTDVVLSDISSGVNPIVFNLNQKNKLNEKEMGLIKINMTEYVKKISDSFSNSASQILQELTNQQQNFVQTLRKVDLVLTKTDGNLISGGEPRVFNLTDNSDFKTMSEDADKISKEMKNFITDCITNKIIIENYKNFESFNPINNLDTKEKPFYLIIVRTFQSKKNEFKNAIIKGDLLKNKKLVSAFDSVYNDLVAKFLKELEKEETEFQNGKKKVSDKFIKGFDNLTYTKGKKRKTNYTTEPSSLDADQKQRIKSLYATVNPNTDINTFDGKITFN